jgi:hypothetical protein
MSALSGKEALDEIDRLLDRARADFQTVANQFSDARSGLARLRQEEVGLYAELAKLRLLAIEQGSLLDALNDADRKAGKVLDDRKEALDKVDQSSSSAQATLAEIENRRTGQRARVEAASRGLDEAEANAQARLAVDEAYKAQLEHTEQASFIADQAEEKAAAARRDREEKGQPYEADPLFSYLWSRGYGTSKYRAWPLARWLDGRVARLSNYEDSRRNYSLLIDIPVRLGEHAETMRGQFDREVEALRGLERAAAEAADVPALRESLEKEEESLSEIDAGIAAEEDLIRSLTAERKSFAAGEDDYYKHAIEALSDAMRGESIPFLKERAARTPDRKDDDIVRRLVELGEESERAGQNLAEFTKLHERESHRLEELEDVRRRFKSERLDDSRSEFLQGALIALVLRQFLTGSVSSNDVWKTIMRQHRMKPQHTDFGTMRFPRARGSGPWRGGGLGGGGFRGGGRIGGGGFRTGGKF